MSHIARWIGTAALCVFAGSVGGNLVTFDGSPTVSPGGVIAGGEFFVEDGVYVEAWEGDPTFSSPGVLFFNLDQLILDETAPGESKGIAIQLAGGGLFDLISFDAFDQGVNTIAYLNSDKPGNAPLGGGWTAIPGPIPMATLSPSGFTGISTLWIGTTPNGGTASLLLDNIVIQAVPEPASLAVLALGCVGLLARSRRRAKQSANQDS